MASFTPPALGQPNSTEDGKIVAGLTILDNLLNSSDLVPTAGLADSAVTTAKITDANVTTAKIADSNVTTVKIADANVTGAKLAADVVGVYRLLVARAGATSVSAADHWFTESGLGTGITPAAGMSILDLAAADYAIAGRTTKLRVRAQHSVGATPPAATLTVGLYPVTGLAAGAYTFGAVVAGSTVAFVTTAANTLARSNSGDFAIPADGAYLLGVDLDVAPAAATGLSVQLQLRHV